MKIREKQNSHIYGDCSLIKFHLDKNGFTEISGSTKNQNLHEDSNLDCNWHIQKASSVTYYEHSQCVKEGPENIHLSFSLGNYEDMYITIILPDNLYNEIYQLLKSSILCDGIEYAMEFINFELIDIFEKDEYKNNKIFSGKNIYSMAIGRQIEERWTM